MSGIVKASIALPDVHSGYGFAIGNVAAFDMSDPESIVSPGAPLSPERACYCEMCALLLKCCKTGRAGGVGFDINCGVRLLRTNLVEADVTEARPLFTALVTLGRAPEHSCCSLVALVPTSLPPRQVKEQLAQSLFDHIPVGVGSQGIIPTTAASLEASLQMGMDWCAPSPGRRAATP